MVPQNGETRHGDIQQERQDVLRALTMEKLLRGANLPLVMFEKLLELSEIRFSSDSFIVIVLTPVECANNAYFRWAPTESMTAEGAETFDRLVGDILSEFRSRLSPLGVLLDGNMWDCLPIIVNPHQALSDGELDYLLSDIAEACEAALAQVEARLHVQLKACISSPCRGLMSIYTAFRLAFDLTVYVTTNKVGGARVFTHAEYLSRPRQEPMLINDAIKRFYNAMGAWDFISAAKYLSSFLGSYVKMGTDSIRSLRYNIMGHLRVALCSMTPTVSPQQQEELLEEIDAILSAYTISIDDFNAPSSSGLSVDVLVFRIFEKIATVLQNDPPEGDSVIRQSAEYIRQNYGDPALSLTQISEQCGLQLSTYSRQFKKAFGLRPLEYLHQVRLNAAKSLLASTEQSLAAIAEAVGYMSCTSFIQAFKRYEGITPGKYREMFCLGQRENENRNEETP